MVVKIQQRHDKADNWTAVNPVLLNGEMGIETDTKKFKIGNGTTAWNSLEYFEDKLVHLDGAETLEGVKTFYNGLDVGTWDSKNLTISHSADANVYGYLTVKGQVGGTTTKKYNIEGTAEKAYEDANGKVIADTYQTLLAKDDDIDWATVDWNTIVTEGVYTVHTNSEWDSDKSPKAYNTKIARQGILVVKEDVYGNVIQIYTPMNPSATQEESEILRTVVYRQYHGVTNSDVSQVITREWKNWTTYATSDTAVVHTTGDEKISGKKTFNDPVKITTGEGSSELPTLDVGKIEIRSAGDAVFIDTTATGSGMQTPITFRTNADETLDITIDTQGIINGKCTKDGDGNVIVDTYATKEEVGRPTRLITEPTFIDKVTESDAYDSIVDRKYDTFDTSKVNLANSITTTTDGYVYGFSTTNYLSYENSLVLGAYDFSIRLKADCILDTREVANRTRQILFQGITSDKHKFSFGLNPMTTETVDDVTTNYYTTYLIYYSGDDTITDESYTVSTAKVELGEHTFVLKDEGGELELLCDDVLVQDTTSVIPSTVTSLTFSKFTLGANQYVADTTDSENNPGTANEYFLGDMDMRTFYFKRNNKEILNFRKEGYDQIRKINYTNNSVSINSNTDEASGFSTTAYITTPIPATLPSAYVFEGMFTTGADNETKQTIWSTGKFSKLILTEKKLQLGLSTDGATYDLRDLTDISDTIPEIKIDTKYKYRLEFDGSTYIFRFAEVLAEYVEYPITTQALTSKIINTSASVIYHGVDYTTAVADPFLGSIDLSSIKRYYVSDDNPVFQASLKIPYTMSKRGVKIVDGVYAQRVMDCYNQFRTGNYFILDEDNNNFRVPFDSAYGLAHTLYTGYTNGAFVEYDTNLNCTIRGTSMTATATTLPVVFLDSNYYCSFTTSAKSTTSVTPSAAVTQTYLIQGKIVLA